jgi:flagellar biosynthesis protein FlhG
MFDRDRNDQAGGLRKLAGQSEGGKVVSMERAWSGGVQVIAVTSGKGGVGKSTITANLSVALAQQGARVLALDGDLGLANLDQMFGVVPRYNLQDVVESTRTIDEVLVVGPAKVNILPGCSGRYDMANLTEEQRLGLFSAVDTLEDRFDVLIVDTGAGIGSNAVSFAAGAQEVIVVTTPEPTAIRDAFAMIKVLGSRCRVRSVKLLPNQVTGAAEAAMVHQKLQDLAERFFDMQVELLGHVVIDGAATKSIRAGQPLLLHYPRSPAARCLASVARRLMKSNRSTEVTGGIQFFWRRLLGGEGVA